VYAFVCVCEKERGSVCVCVLHGYMSKEFHPSFSLYMFM
jgi:hypothetical protein